MKKIKIGIIGFGNIGVKRYLALKKIKKYKIIIKYICDTKKINVPKNIKYFNNWKKIINNDVDLVIISTPTKYTEIISKKLSGKYNLLVEKPISADLKTLTKIVKKANKEKKIIKPGYNLRFDTGLILLKKLLNQKVIGKTYYCKFVYANGTAKSNTNKIGSLFDMGLHIINLIDWLFKKKFKIVSNFNQRNEYFNRKKIDNSFQILKFKNIICSLHHGFCSWKNQFYVEICGSKGFIKVSSLPKWGMQKLVCANRKYPSGKPIIKKIYKFAKDNSWENELNYVIKNVVISNYKTINNESLDTLNYIKKNN